MCKFFSFVRIGLFLYLSLITFLSFSQSPNIENTNKFKVKFTRSSSEAIQRFVNSTIKYSSEGNVKVGLSSIDRLNNIYEVKNIKRLFPYSKKFEKRHNKYGLDLWFEFETSTKKTEELLSCIEDYKNDENIDICEPYLSVELYSLNQRALPIDTINDPRLDEQWHYKNTGQTGGTIGSDINLFDAWQIETGSNDVIVAIIDGGVDYNHVDLSDAMWINEIEMSGTSGVDDDGNGYIDDIYGYGFGDNTGIYVPGDHGTHVGGTVGAVNNNGIGVAGVAGGNGVDQGVRLMSCATFGSYSTGGFAEAFIYAADNGAVISQNSWGYTSSGYYEQSVLDAIDYFIANAGYDELGDPIGPMQGGLVIFAAGNSNSTADYYPGYYDPVLSVAATNHNDEKSWYSNYGTWVDIAAPGGETSYSTYEGVLSTLPSNNYGFYQGTSMACPHVSGVAALIVSKFGGTGLTAQDVWDRLVYNIDSIDAYNPSYIGQLGSGRLNAFKVLIENDSIAPNPIADLEVINITETTVELAWTATGFSADSGSASSYDLRYAEFEITSDNFELATQVFSIPRPNISGSAESFIVENLNPQSTYWFALKAADYFNNTSEISNIVTAETPEAPIIGFDPAHLMVSMDSANEAVLIAQIVNSGAVDLNYSIPEFNQVSNTTKKIYTEEITIEKGQNDTRIGEPVLYGSGADGPDGYGYSWVDNKNGGGPVFDWIDITSLGTQLSLGDDSYQMVDLPFDFPFYDSLRSTVYVSSNGFISFNSSGASSLSNQNLPSTNSPNDLIALLWDDLYPGSGGTVHYYGDSEKFIVQYTDVREYGSSDNFTMQLILYRTGNILLQYLEINGINSSNTIGIENATGTDGMNIAFNTSYIEDSLAISISTKPGFITSVTPAIDTVPANSSREIELIVNSTELSPNIYADSIAIESNDPLNSTSYLPIYLHVKGITNITSNIDSIQFENKFVGTIDSIPITITNNGTDSLYVSDINFVNDYYTINTDTTFALYNNESREVYIIFNPQINGTFIDSIIFINNSNTSEYSIPIFGASIYPPVFNLDPHSFSFEGIVGDTLSDFVTVDNISGQSDLIYNLTNSQLIKETVSNLSLYNLPEFKISVQDPDNNSSIKKQYELAETDIELNNLSGKKIGAYAEYLSILEQDIQTRGGQIYYLSSPIQVSVLDSLDAIIIDDNIEHLSTSEINLLRNFISNGKKLLSTSDNNTSKVNQLLEDTNIEALRYTDFIDLHITNIKCHSTTANVDTLFASFSGTYFVTNSTEKEIMYDENNNVFMAISDMGTGEIAVLGNEMPSDYAIAEGFDNRLFANQLVDWLCGTSNNWIDIPQNSDTLNVGESKQIPFKILTDNLIGGQYEGKVYFESNDPSKLADTVTIDLYLTGIPKIEVNKDILDFDTCFVSYYYSKSVNIKNTGSDTLFITDIISTNSDFTCNESNFYLLPEQTRNATISYLPTSAEIDNGLIRIFSNDTSMVYYEISLTGKAYNEPVLGISNRVFNESLYSGETMNIETIIDNFSGGYKLDWNARIEFNDLNKSIVQNEIENINNFGEKTISSEIDAYLFVDGEIDSLSNSPVNLTSLTIDNTTNIIYGQENSGYAFYSYTPETDSWTQLASCPLNSGNNGGATYLDGKIYTAYTNSTQIGVYDILSNTWTTISNSYYIETGNIESSDSLIYLLKNNYLISYNPNSSTWERLATPPFYFESWGGMSIYNNKLYAHKGNGNDEFAVYDIFSDSWTTLPNLPNGGILGSAIDTQNGKYYTYGSYGGNNLYEYDIVDSTWTTYTIPNFHIDDGGLVYISSYAYKGIYFIQGENGNGFARLNTSGRNDWLTLMTSNGSIATGESSDFNMTINAENVEGGIYTANVIFSTNEPTNNKDTVIVNLDVTGAAYIGLSRDTVIFSNTYVNDTCSETIEIYNTGTIDLEIINTEFTNSFYSSTYIPSIIPAGGSAFVELDFVPTVDGYFEAELIINSNSHTNSEYKILLTGNSLYPPKFSSNHISFEEFCKSGNKIANELIISNIDGGSPLLYEIDYISGISSDTTSIQYYDNYNSITYHNFVNITNQADSIVLTVTLNGDYNDYSEYSSLYIEDSAIGIINDINFPDGTDYTKRYLFDNSSLSNWLEDGELNIEVRNSYEVDYGYGEARHEVQLQLFSPPWLIPSEYSGTIEIGNSDTVNLEFDATNLQIGTYEKDIEITTNDPNNRDVTIPVILNVVDQTAPNIISPISDQVRYLSEHKVYIDLNSVFYDEDGDELIFSASAEETTLAITSIEDNNLIIELLGTGSTLISITADDNFNTPVTDEFLIIIKDNFIPEVISEISDITMGINDDTYYYDLDTIFTDADGDVLTYTYTINNPDLVTVEIQSSILAITPVELGSVIISINATDNKSNPVVESFIAKVIKPSVPIVINPINDTTLYLSDNILYYDLESTFDDENKENLSYRYENDNNAFNINLSGANLSVHTNIVGTVNIIVYASNSSYESSDSFSIEVLDTVGQIAPIVLHPLNDTTVYSSNNLIKYNLNETFHDENDDELTFSIENSNSNISVNLDNSILSINTNTIGSTKIIVYAFDGYHEVSDTLIIEILDINDQIAPVVINPIADTSFVISEIAHTYNLNETFYDENGDVLRYRYESSNEDFEIELSDSLLIIVPNLNDSATITIFATDGYFEVTDTFLIEIIDSITNISRINLKNDIHFYPNPFKSNIHFEMKMDNYFHCNLNIININGITVKKLEFSDIKGCFNQEIDASDLSEGIYIMQLILDNKEVVHYKLIKE